LFSSRLAIDIIFVASVALAISISVIVAVRAVSSNVANTPAVIAPSGGRLMPAPPASSGEPVNVQNGNNGAFSPTITDPDANIDPNASSSKTQAKDDRYGVALAPILTDAQLVDGVTAKDPGQQLASAIYGSSPYILPITWGAVAGTLIWRGRVRSAWSRQGYDYEMFRLVAKMRGGPTRVKLLNLIDTPKNKLQLAKELGVDWKTIDNHIATLTQNKLAEEKGIVGTARYYVITENGRRVLSLLMAGQRTTEEDNKSSFSSGA
jgi:hypothetical protein